MLAGSSGRGTLVRPVNSVAWLAENRTNLQLRENIRQAAQEWEQHQREESYLVHRGGRLEDAQALSRQAKFLNQLEDEYVKACVELRDRQEREKEESRQRELETARKIAQESQARLEAEEEARKQAEEARKQAEERAKQEKKARKAAQTRSIVTFAAFLVLILAVYQWHNAYMSSKAKLAQSLSNRAQAQQDTLPQLSLLLAVESVKLDILNKTYAEGLLSQLLGNIGGIPLGGHEKYVTAVVFSPKSNWLATGSQDGTVRLWDKNNPDRPPKFYREGLEKLRRSPLAQMTNG